MLQRFFQSSQNSADSTLQHNALKLRNATRRLKGMPAAMLAFLLLIGSTSGVLYLTQQPARNAAADKPVTPPTAQIPEAASTDAESLTSKATNKAEPNKESSRTNSIKVESSIVNGVADTKVEVNGQEVPVDPNTSQTHTSIDNSDGGTTQITTFSTQASNGGYNFNSNTSTSSSFSHSVNNSTTVGGNQ